MMGSRGESSPQVTALVTLCELLELARSADLPAHIAQLREAEKAARTAFGELDKKTAELDARHKALDERDDTLEVELKKITAREIACALREEETARQLDSFDKQKAGIAAQKQEVSDRANLVAADQTALEAAKLLHAGEHEADALALLQETDRLHRESEAAIQVMRNKAAADIAEMRAKAEAEMAAQQEELRQRIATIAAREAELHRERARISALLQE